MSAAPLLEIADISLAFRGLRALDGVGFAVMPGTITALIGPNGAGKTTLFNVVAGLHRPDRGRIRLAGADITGLPPDRACRAGIGRTFQLVRPFAALSVLDNVLIGALLREPGVAAARRRALAILDRLGLAAKAALPARSLTLPERKRLETARALATGPRILLLDEVMAGLRPVEVDAMVATFAALVRESGLTILLTEHVMRAVMALAQSIVVLDHGQKICEGAPDQVARDPRVLASYLGPAGTGEGGAA